MESDNLLDSTGNSSNFDSSSSLMVPKNHPHMGSSIDPSMKDQCPFLKMQQGKTGATLSPDSQRATNDEDVGDLSSSSEDEDGQPKRAKGGCPFLPSDRKKNPGLEHIDEMYGTHYLSRYSAYLEDDGQSSLRRDFSGLLKKKAPHKLRRVFESYPIYLKHTLFHDEDMLKRIRKKDVVERFFAYDKYRERGNRLFNKGKYEEAIFLYEWAYSCFKWLEMVEDKEEGDNKTKKGSSTITRKTENQPAEEEEESKEDSTNQRGGNQLNSEDKKQQQQQKKPQTTTKQFREDKKTKAEEENICELPIDSAEEVRTFKENDGVASNRIQEIIQQRSEMLKSEEENRAKLLQKRMLQATNPSEEQIANSEEVSDASECSEDHLKRIQENDSDGAGSLEVEGFDDLSDRNMSSDEEKEIGIEEIQEKAKNPDETAIIMDESETKRLIAEEMFLRQNHKEDREFKKKYRLYISTFTDENVRLVNGEDLIDANDIDLRLSMLVSALLSLGVCYMKLGNFGEAMSAFSEAESYHKKGSIALIRKVQCRLSDKRSTYRELIEANEWLTKAIEVKKDEKVFNSGKASLVVMNIANHESFCRELTARLSAKIEEVREVESERIRDMIERVVELQEIEADMLERGVTPRYSDGEEEGTLEGAAAIKLTDNLSSNNNRRVAKKDDSDTFEEELAEIIEGKFYQLIEGQMFAEKDGKANNKQARMTAQLRGFLETLTTMRFYQELDFAASPQTNDLIVTLLGEYNNTIKLTAKNLKRFEKLKREAIKDAFNDTEHHFEIYKWALDEYFQRRKAKQSAEEAKQKKKNEKAKAKNNNDPKGSISRRTSQLFTDLFGRQSIAQLIVVFIAFYLLVIFLRGNSSLIPALSFAKKNN